MSRGLRQVAYEQPSYDRPLREFVFFDFETTGLSPRTDRVIEIAALRVGQAGKVLASFESLIRIDQPLSSFITKLTGISDEMLADQRPAKAVMPEFLEFIGDQVVVSYNISFDMGFLRAEAARLRRPIHNASLCALQMARRKLPQLSDHKLHTVAKYCGCKKKQNHRALDDCHMALEAFVHLMRL
jgi:DNA polymerase III epsilon subunit family exonuclease